MHAYDDHIPINNDDHDGTNDQYVVDGNDDKYDYNSDDHHHLMWQSSP